MNAYPKLAAFKTAEAFAARQRELNIHLPFDSAGAEHWAKVLSQPIAYRNKSIGNRIAALPMEGWDANTDGTPTDLTRRRWRHFGLSGCKLIWGCEAVAVRHDGRANPNQLLLTEQTRAGIATLRDDLLAAHNEAFGNLHGLYVGLQLTHSGRYARPDGQPSPRVLYHHPLLERKHAPADPPHVFSDAEIDDLIGDFVDAAKRAAEIGFDFVDLKHCHGYLGHEFLSAVDRPGRYGGSLENRTRFLREIIAGIRRDAPALDIGLRLSLFDAPPFTAGSDGTGIPMTGGTHFGFGADPASPNGFNLAEPLQFLQMLRDLDVRLICLTAGSPYYNPHIQRPAIYPPSDGYLPPEDPLVGVARQADAVAQAKRALPEMLMVGSAYSYLQEWLAPVAAAQVAANRVDFVGLGRLLLSYPQWAADVLAGRPVQARKLCRTFSDCTTAPRNGMVSGCYPLDEYYKIRPEAKKMAALRKK